MTNVITTNSASTTSATSASSGMIANDLILNVFLWQCYRHIVKTKPTEAIP